MNDTIRGLNQPGKLRLETSKELTVRDNRRINYTSPQALLRGPDLLMILNY
jgi:hypothetical protein